MWGLNLNLCFSPSSARRPRTAPAASAPLTGASAMTAATSAFFTNVTRLNSGVYSSVAPACRGVSGQWGGLFYGTCN